MCKHDHDKHCSDLQIKSKCWLVQYEKLTITKLKHEKFACLMVACKHQYCIWKANLGTISWSPIINLFQDYFNTLLPQPIPLQISLTLFN